MEDESHILVHCAGEMTLARAEEIQESLRLPLSSGRPVAVDCTAVTEADLSFIQLLMAARISAMRRGVRLTLTTPANPVLLAALRRAGFLADMPLPHDAFWNGGE